MRTAHSSALAVPGILLIAAALAVEVIRLSTASTFAESRPPLASRFAPLAPDSLAGSAMAEVGKAAAQGTEPPEATMQRLRMLAAIAPLRPEPFLVEAALAERDGDYSRARRLLARAERRAPRSPAAHYLLADISIREGKIVEALNEMAVMSRLVPGTSAQLAPALAQYAKTPGARGELAGIVAKNPKLKDPLLSALASDPDNADLILSVAGNSIRSTDLATRGWQARLLNGLVRRGEIERAYRLWRHFVGVSDGPRPLLYNGDFNTPTAPEPFDWTLSSSGAGVAEAEDGRLRVLHFGRQNARLVSQLLLLPPGSYRFDAPVSGDLAEGALKWKLACRPGNKTLIEIELGKSPAMTFAVPPGCATQLLELDGQLLDMPQNSDVRIGPVRLGRTGS